MHQQYTMLIGLTKDNNMMNSGGSTILWFPVDKNSIYYSDYNIRKAVVNAVAAEQVCGRFSRTLRHHDLN